MSDRPKTREHLAVVHPLTPAEEKALRADVERRLGLAAVFAVVGGGEDVLSLARLLRTLDYERGGSR